MVSVVIPVYNRAQKIVDAVHSIQAQTTADWELILVDDGSKDQTPQVLRDLEKSDKRIRAVFQENKGAQSARNAGIRAAKGEWVAFLDSDDQWLPDSLERRLELARREGVEVVHSEGYLVEGDGPRKVYGLPSNIGGGRVYAKLLKNEGPMFQGLMATKKALEGIGLLDESIVAFQEWDTVLRLAKKYRFGFAPEPTYIYDCRGTDTISKQFCRNGIGLEQILHKHWRDMLFLTGPGTLIAHYEAVVRWYEKGNDAAAVARCFRTIKKLRIMHPGSYLQKLGRFFKK